MSERSKTPDGDRGAGAPAGVPYDAQAVADEIRDLALPPELADQLMRAT